jgi:predicted LPLAT superfamily acyltransferase
MSRRWLQQSERISPNALHLMRWAALRLGRRTAQSLLYPGVLYVFLSGRRSRDASRAFLSRVFGRRASNRQVLRHMHRFAATVVDRVYFLTGQHDRFEIELHGLEQVQERARRGQGMLLLGSHLGSFDILRTLAVTQEKLPIKVLMHHQHNRNIMAILDALNVDVAGTVIPLGQPDSMLRAKEWVDGGGLLGLLGDRVDASSKTIDCRFLGEPANLPAGPMLLAAALQAPVVLFFGLYHGGNRYSIHFELLAECITLPAKDREAHLRDWTQRYLDRLEYYARQAPYNWFNFYDYWEKPVAP